MTDDKQPGRVAITWLAADDVDDARLIGLVADFAQAPTDDLRIVRACRSCGSDQHGKPQVVRPAGGEALHLSLARSGDLAVVAVTDAGPIGVDLERTTGDDGLTTWVRKESVVKATGHGLRIDPDRIGVGRADGPPSLDAWPAEEPLGSPAWIVDLPAPPGHVAAVTTLSPEQPAVTTPAAPGA